MEESRKLKKNLKKQHAIIIIIIIKKKIIEKSLPIFLFSCCHSSSLSVPVDDGADFKRKQICFGSLLATCSVLSDV